MAKKPARKPADIGKTADEHVVKALTRGLKYFPVLKTFAEYVEDYYPTQFKRTIEDFRGALLDHARGIDRLNCDSEQLFALYNNIIIEAMRTASQKKRNAFSAILLNFMSGKSAAEHKVELFTQLVVSLTELEMLVLHLSQHPWEIAQEKGLIEPGALAQDDVTVEKILDCDRALSRLAFLSLRQKGLLEPTADLPAAPQFPVNISLLSLSPLGKEFLEWITYGSDEGSVSLDIQ